MKHDQMENMDVARIRSDHIVTVFDRGYDKVSQMLLQVMELLKGQTLEEMVEERGPLPDN